jgi:ABC-type antimicrobial peptide transport system permease subunit
MTAVAAFSHSPDVQEITRTYGFLRIVALGLVVLSLIALMLYLSGRGRSQLVTSALLRRMGMTQHSQARSVALESSVLVAIATIVGLGAALITAGAIVDRVDPLSQYSPAPITEVPWTLLLGSAVGVIAAAGVVGAILTLTLPRSGVGEQLRVS